MLAAWVVLAVVASSDWECDFAKDLWRPSGLEPPCAVLRGEGAQRLAAAKKAWALDDEQAACVLESFSFTADAGVPRETRVSGDPAGWRRCTQRWPGVFSLWVGLIRASGAHAGTLDVSALAGVEGGVELASRLLSLDSSPGEGLARVILEQQPERLVEVLQHPQVRGRDAFALALPLLDDAATRQPPLTPKELEAVARAALRTPLAEGWLELAAEVWATLPPATRAALRSRPLTEVSHTISPTGMAAEESGDLRPMLALALVAAGQKDEARTVWAANPDAGAVGRGPREDGDAITALLAFHLTRGKHDPWEAALSATRAQLSPEAYALVLPWVAPYHALIADFMAWALRPDARDPEVSSSVNARVVAAHQRAMARVRTAWAAVPAYPDGSSADAGVTPAALPDVAWPFVERTTPWKGKAGVKVKPKGLPRGVWPLRVERSGRRTVVLALSQRVDPTGEVSMGGYWLLVSDDGQRTWRELYLGIADHRPFHAHESSKVPLLDERDVVRLDVEEAAVDERTITFPPLATRAPVTRAHVVLEATLEALAKDSDGDGLTDLLEARLLLDPSSRDTDGDGIGDREDATPRLDDRLTPTALSHVYNAFLEGFSERAQPQPLVVPPNAKPGVEAAMGTPKPMDLEQTRFLVAPAGALAGLRPLTYVVTLTPAELQAAVKKFGAFYPMDVEVHVSKDGKHGYVRWSERWRGGAVRLDQGTDGRWVTQVLSSWIT
ncbi:MAG: hypothetical protein AB1730_28010 [Myxococcota bacterium]